MADYRFERTDADIQRTFIQAVQQQGFERLNIAQLAKLSRVDRSTFYAHYDSLYALAETMIQAQVDALFDAFQKEVLTQQHGYDFFSAALVDYLNANAATIKELRLISLGTNSFDTQCRQRFTTLYVKTLKITATSYTSYLFVNMAMSDLDFVLQHHRAPERRELQSSLQKMVAVINRLSAAD